MENCFWLWREGEVTVGDTEKCIIGGFEDGENEQRYGWIVEFEKVMEIASPPQSPGKNKALLQPSS